MTVSIRRRYRSILRQELTQRKRFNRKYSLRAFARHIGISPSRLSEVLSGRYGISPEAAAGIANRLGYTTEQAQFFCDLVTSEQGRSAKDRRDAHARLEGLREKAFPQAGGAALNVKQNEEIALWGAVDFNAAKKFLAKRDLSPYRDPKRSGAATVGLVVRRSFDDHRMGHLEFFGLVLVADVLSTEGYSICGFQFLTDSPDLINLKKETLGFAPKLTGRIQLDLLSTKWSASVADETGAVFLRFKIGRSIPRTPLKIKEFSLFRNTRLPDGSVGKSRVTGVQRSRERKFNFSHDLFSVKNGSKLHRLLTEWSFRPTEWQVSFSEFNFFELRGLK